MNHKQYIVAPFGDFASRAIRASLVRFLIGFVLVSLVLPTLGQGVVSGAANGAAENIADLAETKKWKRVEQLIESGASVNRPQPDRMTALHWAAFHGNEKIVDRLIAAGAKVGAVTEYQVSPLSLACQCNHTKAAKVLIAAKADVESKRLGGERPLMYAARAGNFEIAKALIDAGAQVDATESRGQTALMWAAAEGNVDVMKALVKAGADPVKRVGSGFNAWFFAAREGQTAAIEYLLSEGVEIDVAMDPSWNGSRQPRKGMTALMLAVESGHFELAIELIEKGAQVNDTRSGFSPLHVISWVRKTERGESPAGDPPPRGSGSINSLEFVRKIVELGAKVNLQLEKTKSRAKTKLSYQQATPFLMASARADVPLMKLLLELGADPKLKNADQCTALMAAAGVGVVAVGEEPGTVEEVSSAIELLIEKGLDVNAKDKNGETAMHGSAYRSYPEIAKLLWAHGADPKVWNQKNRHGWTPHRIAAGYRPGSFKPSPEMIAALDLALTKYPSRKE